MTPDGMIGASFGELACGYVDGCMTKSQTLLAAYWRGQSVKIAGPVDGKLARVGEFFTTVPDMNFTASASFTAFYLHTSKMHLEEKALNGFLIYQA